MQCAWCLTEAVRAHLASQGASGSVMTGYSLDGFMVLVYHIIYGMADHYAPLLAGPDMVPVLVDTNYRYFLSELALAQSDRVRNLLDFLSAFQASETPRVSPLLALYDLPMLYAYHNQCYVAYDAPVAMIVRGHLTGALALGALCQHLLTCLRPGVQKTPEVTTPEQETRGEE